MTVTVGNKIWELPGADKHHEMTTYALVKILDRDGWSLRDIYEASQIIEQMPIVKEVVLTILTGKGGKMTINAKPISSNTAICPDCGKPHRIRRVSAGRYIKGCAPPCCVYWVEDGQNR